MKNININWIIYSLVLIIIIIVVFIFLPKSQKEVDNDNLKSSFSSENEIEKYDILEGEKDAKLSLVVYENYLDPFSYELQKTLDMAKEEFGSDLLFIYRPFIKDSLDNINANLMVICANEYDKGSSARQLIYSEGKENFSLNKINDYENQLSIKNNQLLTCMDNMEKENIVESLQNQLESRSIYGSPTIVINNEIITGARPYQDFVDSNGDSIDGLRSLIIRHLNN